MILLHQAESSLVAIDDLAERPWNSILAYSSGSMKTCRARIREMKRLGVKYAEFSGSVRIGNVGVLGKGCTSIIVKAILDGNTVALKIRRTDSNRPSVIREAHLQCLANKVNVGAKVYGFTKNVLAMEIVEGSDIISWVKSLRGKGSTASLRNMLLEILTQCFALDSIGLDHGELSNFKKHVIIGKRAVIIDFETASLGRRAANVTSASQYIFIGGPVASTVRRRLGLKNVDAIIDALRQYKSERSEKSFRNALSKCRLFSPSTAV